MKLLLLRALLCLHNILYLLIGKAAVWCNKGVHPKHRLMRYHDFFVNNIKTRENVLDVGCGRGEVARSISKQAKSVVAIDIKKKAIREAKKYNPCPNVTYIVGDATKYAFDRTFDAIVLSNVLEHIHGRRDFLKKMSALAPKILVRVPLIDRDWITLMKKELGVEYRLDKTHCVEYTLQQFIDEINEAGFLLETYYVRFGELYAVLRKKEAGQ